MIIWTCVKPDCGHEVVSEDKPEPIKWTDGHVCYFKPVVHKDRDEETDDFRISTDRDPF